jgi:hypothetical protein
VATQAITTIFVVERITDGWSVILASLTVSVISLSAM